jgi:hypothetical protein
MNCVPSRWSRRRFLAVAASAWWSARGIEASPSLNPTRRMVLSFYCDDTGPETAGVAPFRAFLDYCARHGIAGESSLVLGSGGRSMARDPSPLQREYLREVARAWECGIDTHMELMTHRGLFDFEGNREPPDAVHEGLWLNEPGVGFEDYRRYFGGIIAEAKGVDLLFTGLTWPGCVCEVCRRRYEELRASGHRAPNPNVWRVLLSLAREGGFRGPVVPCFLNASETDYGIHRKAADGKFAVYDLMPNARDYLGSWQNSADRVNPDYYITSDGEAGIVVRHLAQGAPYCIWYAHWQGLNPGNGVGWDAFRAVVERIRRHLGDRVVWMRPSDIARRFHETGAVWTPG